METQDRINHWQNIYKTKHLNEVSWYQPTPSISLKLIANLNLSKSAKIIDIGGGDSFLVDYLLELGYTNISVLDISEEAILRAKSRLGSNASKVTWITSDIVTFKPTEEYDIWHDRATFHFLTENQDIEKYKELVSSTISNIGNVIIGTFAIDGPKKCSGIDIKQYSKESLEIYLRILFY